MQFLSDTAAPAHPAMLSALEAANAGDAPSYGADTWTRRAEALLADVFETDVAVWLTASGTAANALTLAALCPPTGAIACHTHAHIEEDERGAPVFFTGGAVLALIPGAFGKMDAGILAARLAGQDRSFVHRTPIDVVSLTNLTESGSAYSHDETAALASLARQAGCMTHLDGARLANAVVGTGESLKRLTWQAGVDAVTFGMTKNGAMGCEAIVLFGAARARLDTLRAYAKRAGHMPPKMRFIAAQMVAALTDDLWLQLASQANAAAKRLATGLAALPGVTLAHASGMPDGNEVFAHLPPALATHLRAAGAQFYDWPDGSARLVCHWATPHAQIDAFLDLARAHGTQDTVGSPSRRL